MNSNLKEVIFAKWCAECAHFALPESEDPCNDCLAEGSNEDSTKPLYFKAEE